MPGNANNALAVSTEDAEGFIFSWVRRYPGAFWLWGFLVLSVVLHAGGFYLFQVVYPSSARLEPFPAHVMILDEKNAVHAVLLQELNDRLVFLQPASSGSDSRKNIEDFSVSFRPSFAAWTPPFRKPFSGGQKPDASAYLELPGNVILFPPFREESTLQSASGSAIKPKAGPSGDKPAIRRRWSLEGDLASRVLSVTQAERFDKALPPVGEGRGIALSILVDANGEVKQISVVSGKNHPAAGDFVKAVERQLKFEPRPGIESTRGVLTIRQ